MTAAIFLGAVLYTIPLAVFAIGISVSPPTLSLQSSLGKDGTAHFTVRNPSTEVGLFEAYAEEFEREITLVPSRFVLEAGEKREVTVRASRRETGAVRTAIAIEGRPLGDPSSAVGGGVRLPFLLEVSPANGSLSAVFLSGASGMALWFIAGALTVLFLLRRVSLSPLKRYFQGATLRSSLVVAQERNRTTHF